MPVMRRLMLVPLLAVLAGAPPLDASAAPAPPVTAEMREIDALIARVERAQGVVFVRNGRDYSAAEAAAHLRRKFKAARGRVRTPEQFIEHLGTRSSITGRAYRVRLAEGRELDSALWLTQLLRQIRNADRARAIRAPASARQYDQPNLRYSLASTQAGPTSR